MIDFLRRFLPTGLALVLVLRAAIHFVPQGANVNVITWDVYGYYAYLPAVLTYGAEDNFNFTKEHFSTYQISSSNYQVADAVDGRMAPIYTGGMALLWTPGYVLASLAAKLHPAWPADGLSPPYQWAIIVGSWISLLFGVYFLSHVLRVFTISGSSHTITLLTLGAILFGTNFFYYAVFEPGMPHAYLFSLYAALLYFTERWHTQPRRAFAIGIGVCIALLCLVRPSEVIAVLIPLLYACQDRKSFRHKLELLRGHSDHIVILIGVGIAIISLQVLYWQHTTGLWIFNGYAKEHHFDFLAPHIYEGLFSFRKGWLLYTPIMVLALVGLIVRRFRASDWGFGTILYVVINVYIVLSWHMWWYASCFGMRALVQSYAVLALPLAGFYSFAFNRGWTKILVLFLTLACVGLNLFQTWQYRHRILALDEMTREFYLAAWGQTTLEPSQYLLIDNNERLHDSTAYRARTLAAFRADTSTFLDSSQLSLFGRLSAKQTPAQTYATTLRHTIESEASAQALSQAWVGIEAQLLMSSDRADEQSNARLVIDVLRADSHLLWRSLRWQRYQPIQQWIPIKAQLRLPPKLLPGDVISLYSMNNGPDTVYVNRLELLHWERVVE